MYRLALWLAAALLAACSSGQTLVQPITPEATRTPVPGATPFMVPMTPEATDEPADPLVLRLWWPEVLTPADRPAAAVLRDQITAFEAAHPDLQVEMRLKRVNDVGGIMSTLRTAWSVAPGALPDLTLLRRSDLLVAERDGLIRPMNEDAAAMLNDLYPTAAALGQVSGDIYGVTYLVELEHMAYHPGEVEVESWRFEELLRAEVPLTFPVGRPGALNPLFLTQYLQLTETSASTAEPQAIDTDALLRLFTFYEQATNMGLIDPLVLETASPNDYAAQLTSGAVPAALVSVSLYLRLLDAEITLAAAPLPTETGEAVAMLDGWVWVSTTPDDDRQRAAARFLDWMMNAERQALYARAVALLPSQDESLRYWVEAGAPLADYAAFVEPLLEQGMLMPSDVNFDVVGRAIQSALAGVLAGQFTAQAAVDAVLAQVGG